MAAETRGAKQTAYRILVASSAQSLAGDRSDTWDSGEIASSQMFQIEYGGKPLQPATRYYWKLRVWDEKHRPSAWSAPAEYTTGLLAADQWKARWIAAEPDDAHSPQARESTKPLPIFRHEFSASKKVSQALVFVSGLGQYELHINGRNVTRAVLTPGWTNYRKRVFYDTYDITGLLMPGRNAVGVLLGNGMYHVPGLRERYTKFTGSFGQPKLILQIHLRYADGATEVVGSDKTWRTSPGPITFTSIYGGEDYDARQEQAGWDRPGFRDAGWQPALEVQGPGGELVAEQSPPIEVLYTYRPVKTAQPEPGVTVFDLGQNFSGWPEITVRGRRGATVKMIAGELLDASGQVTQHSAGASIESPNRFSYTLGGGRQESWHPHFSYYGFRYVRAESAGAPGAPAGDTPQIVSLSGQFLHDSVETVGSFETSSALFGQIHRLIDMAVLSNMVSVLTDCPHREKLGWLEQTYLAGPSILYNYDAIALYRKMAQDMRDSQLADGMVPSIAPEYVAFVDGHGVSNAFRDSPEWGSAAILSPWTAYQFYGDKSLLADEYGAMRAYAGYLRGKATGHILSYGLGDWYDIGPGQPGISQLTGKELTATAIYYQDLIVIGKVAAVLNRSGDAQSYATEASQVRDAFNARLFHPERGEYDRGSQTANAMPLALGMVPPGYEKAVLRHLVDDIRSHQDHVTAGDIGFHYVVRALTDGGRSDVLFDMLSRTDSPSYGYQLARGATTLTEAWDTNPNSSQNHFMLGHAEEWFYRGLAGINVDFDRPDAERIQIRPIPVGAIESASASYQSVFGEIRSAWTHRAHRFALHVRIPAGSVGTLEIPASNPASVMESGRRPDQATGILDSRATERGVICLVGSGDYTFTSEL
ncbi:MAG: family 78 glycoside hydrolase catalytic domain [Bryobacteraceae bacterium]